jgi:hypothetical protein
MSSRHCTQPPAYTANHFEASFQHCIDCEQASAGQNLVSEDLIVMGSRITQVEKVIPQPCDKQS